MDMNKPTATTTATVLGISDEVTACDCCGRSDLKKTVALSFNGAAAVYYGTTCAALALGRKPVEIKADARAADKARRQAEEWARYQDHAAKTALWQSFLNERAPGIVDFDGKPNTFRQIERLGGYAAARAAYEAASWT